MLTFVDRLAHVVGGTKSLELHRWIDLVAGGLGLNQAMVRGLCIESRRSLDKGQAETQEPADGGAPDLAVAPIAGNRPDESHPGDFSAPPMLPPPAVAGSDEEPHEQRLIWSGVPIRNPDFTGREIMLGLLNDALVTKSQVSVLPQTLHGFGGVGKTQLAVEYVYRYVGQYDLVWWIPAEQPTVVLSSLARLGVRLDVQESEDVQQTVATVLDALATTGLRWLLVFDNADQPEQLTRFVPTAGGHVIVTSRNHEWGQVGNAIEVDIFDRAESVELLRKRGAGISAEDADRLADKLGDLPLALEQAATWQAATGMPVTEYLQLFDEHVRELLSEGKPTSYPTTVAAFLSLAVERLQADSPSAAQLFELFAYLGAEPVSAALLRAGRDATISEPLRGALREPIRMNRAIRDLRRFGLAKVDPNGQLIQVHRLMQLVLREGLTEEQAVRSRSNVQRLLASANPGDPDEQLGWAMHVEIGPHIVPANLIAADSVEGREVVVSQMRYLYLAGDYENSRRLAEIAVSTWREARGEGLGPDGVSTLLATRHLANATLSLGDSNRARELTREAYEGLRRNPQFGEDHEYTLITANGVALDLRILGDYRAALVVDQDNFERHRRVFGDEDLYTLRSRNNVAVNLRMLGDLDAAFEIDTDLVRQWSRTLGSSRYQTLHCQANVARDLLAMGRHEEALELLNRIVPALRDESGPRHLYVLLAARTLAIALLRVGNFPQAVAQAREIYLGSRARFSADHEQTLAAAMTLANALRAAGELGESRNLAVDAVARYHRNFGPRHPFTLAAEVNLALVLRTLGEHTQARALDERAMTAFGEVMGAEHTYTLRTANNLANDLAVAGELAAARQLSEQTLAELLRLRGDEHPLTLACAANTAFDRVATGDQESGQELLDQTVATMTRMLGPEHPDTLDAARGRRAECDLEPSPT
jgi:tetratricopeptide (TPR) repeat protein